MPDGQFVEVHPDSIESGFRAKSASAVTTPMLGGPLRWRSCHP